MPEHGEDAEALAGSSPAGACGVPWQLVDLLDGTLERAERQLQLAQTIGRLAVGFGTQEVLRRLRSLRTESSSTTPRAPSEDPPSETEVAPAMPTSQHGAIDDLIPGYDDLSASQVVKLLDDLSASDLEAVAGHEAAGRARRTILHRVAQLHPASSEEL